MSMTASCDAMKSVKKRTKDHFTSMLPPSDELPPSVEGGDPTGDLAGDKALQLLVGGVWTLQAGVSFSA